MNPFSEKAEQQVGHLGERQLIKHILEWLGASNPLSPAGIGDDAAVIKTEVEDLVLANDCLVLNKHFDPTISPQKVGSKLLKRNISDFAAMGATPSHAVVACLLPPKTSIEWIRGFYKGLEETASDYSILIVGGDISSTFEDLAFTLTLLGTGAEKPLTRRSAQAGDTLWVTGSLGGSIKKKHLEFEPRINEGVWLSKSPAVSSAMDVSDGLATDLLNLCPADCRVELDTDSLPISKDAYHLAEKSDQSPIRHALTDGEDYELLFTVGASINPIEFLQDWTDAFETALTCIGKVITRHSEEDTTIQYRGSQFHSKDHGYEHF